MKFIKTLLEEETPKEVYEIIITTMTGDADDYHTFSFNVETDEDLEYFINFLNELKDKHSDDYSDIDEFNKYFSEDWHYSEYCCRYDSFDSFEIYYYDEDGKKYKVRIVD